MFFPLFFQRKFDAWLFYFLYFHHLSFLPNNQIFFPTVQPESEQETLPLPNSAEPKWPRVSFGNMDDALLSIYNYPPFLAAYIYLLQLSHWEGAWSGKCSCFDWLFASMPWVQLESRNEAWRWCLWRSDVESKFRLPRPLRTQPWLPFNHAAKSHVTAPKLPFCILNPPFSLLFFSLSPHTLYIYKVVFSSHSNYSKAPIRKRNFYFRITIILFS